MRTSTAFSILAVAGSALAAPRPVVVENVHVVYETVVHTVYATGGQSTPTPVAPAIPLVAQVTQPNVGYQPYESYVPKPKSSKAPKSSQASKPKPITTTEAYNAPSSAPVYDVPTSTQVSVAPPVSTEVPATPSPASDYMAVVDEWRSKLGLAPIKRNTNMELLAQRTLRKAQGVMKHFLILPSNGEVLAPGDAGNVGFEKVFVGGWLCEISTLPGLNGVCDEMSKGWTYQGQTDHAKILVDPEHTTIGCALDQGLWCCELSADENPKLTEEYYT